MRSINAGEHSFLLVFDIGDEIAQTLQAYAGKFAPQSAHFYGIGGLERATIAYWNWDTKEYEDIAVNEQVEIVSLIGNITYAPAGIKVHAHAVLGRRDGSTIGGHLKAGWVRPTAEIVWTLVPASIKRERDQLTGLDLIRD